MNDKKYRVYVCGNLHCIANGRDAILYALEQELWALELDADVEVRTSGCQNQCDFGPNIKIWPGPFQYSRLTPEAVRRIVRSHLRDDQPVTELLHTPGRA
jgi:(2Fe-2S) ferredoxin